MSQQSSSFPQQQSDGGRLATSGASSFGGNNNGASSSFGQQNNGASFGQQQNNGASFGSFSDESSFKNTQFPRTISDASIEEFRSVRHNYLVRTWNDMSNPGA